MKSRAKPAVHALTMAISAAVLSACAGTPTPGETRARADLERVRTEYRPGDARPELPTLAPESPLADFLAYAMLNNPGVEAAYYEWAASVARITSARSLPDPRLTFEADIMDVVTAVMPGLMIDLPGPGKLRAAGDVAVAEADVAYFAFEAELLRVAYEAKAAYIRLHFLQESLRVRQQAFSLLGEAESSARQKMASGSGTIQDVLRAQIERDQLANEISNLEDSRTVIESEFRAALGHAPTDGRVPTPAVFERAQGLPDAGEILAMAAARNPRLRRMEAEVRRGERTLALAKTGGVPDFSFGLEADVKSSPVMWRPSASMTLPIWRDRIEADIAVAQGEKRTAEARLSAEQISLAAELASLLYVYRESGRNITLLSDKLRPKARQAMDAAHTGYAAGLASFLDVLDAHRQLLGFELSEIEANAQQELAIAEVSLLVAGAAPNGAPRLPSVEPSSSTAREESRP